MRDNENSENRLKRLLKESFRRTRKDCKSKVFAK